MNEVQHTEAIDGLNNLEDASVELIERHCMMCHERFLVRKNRLKYGRGKFCSKSCMYAYDRRDLERYTDKICIYCDKEFQILKSKLNSKIGAGKYCSRECRDNHRIGEHHPQFIKDSTTDKRGFNWQSQRRKVKRRDNYTCVICGKTDGNLHVHHIIPYRFFEDKKFANDDRNLVTLCDTCHRIEEAIIHKAEKWFSYIIMNSEILFNAEYIRLTKSNQKLKEEGV